MTSAQPNAIAGTAKSRLARHRRPASRSGGWSGTKGWGVIGSPSVRRDAIKVKSDSRAARVAPEHPDHTGVPRGFPLWLAPPKEWFVAEILPSVYEDNFGRQARRSTGSLTGAAGGPYLRFAVAVMREMMEIEISPETVARALKDVKAPNGRRNAPAPVRQRRQGRRQGVPL